MKSWFDLTKQEQISLKNEFDLKNKVLDLRVIFYTLSFVWFTFLAFTIPLLNDSTFNDPEETKQKAIIYGTIFGVCFLLAIINSLMVSKHEKEFKTWLKTRNIEK